MKVNKTLYTFKRRLGTAQGKKLLQFSMFIVISFIFWASLTLNETFIYDVKYPVKITNKPDSITIISEIPNSVKVTIKAKGFHYIKSLLKSLPTIDIDFNKYKTKNRISLGNIEMQELARNMFGSNSIATSFSPDSINLYYTDKPGKSVKLNIVSEAITDNQYIINGTIQSDYKNVLLYSLDNIPSKVTEVETAPIKCDGLKSTTTFKTKVIAPKGMRAIPDSVNVTIPVEPLISKKRIANVEVINIPDDTRLITFPSQIEINYLIPKSLFNNENKFIRITVDYNDIKPNSNKLPIKLIDVPSNYRGATAITDSVEYIIEKK